MIPAETALNAPFPFASELALAQSGYPLEVLKDVFPNQNKFVLSEVLFIR
jgi:hypothetical protein